MVDVRVQVRQPDPCLQLSDFHQRDLQALAVDRAVDELLVQCLFTGDQLLAQLPGFGFHCAHQRRRGGALLVAQLQYFGQLQHVHRSRVAVGVGNSTGPHAAALAIGVDLLRCERTDRAGLGGVGFGSRILGKGRLRDDAGQEQEGQRAHGRFLIAM